jgi:hypothetical protein
MKTFISLLMMLVGIVIFLNVNNIEREINKRYDRKSRKNKNWWVHKYIRKPGYFFFWWDLISGAAALLTVFGLLMLLEIY